MDSDLRCKSANHWPFQITSKLNKADVVHQLPANLQERLPFCAKIKNKHILHYTRNKSRPVLKTVMLESVFALPR